jgi:TolB protein
MRQFFDLVPLIQGFGRVLLAVCVLGAMIGFVPTAARAALEIDITQGNIEPLPIAIPDFFGVRDAATSQYGDTGRIGANISKVVVANLERSGLFEPIDPRAYIQTAEAAQVRPRFVDWRLINAQALVTGKAELRPDGQLRVEFRLWDVFAEQQMIGFVHLTTPDNWRSIAHLISDAIYKRLTGEDGYFDTRVVYVAESGPRSRRVKRLAIMDQDGANHRLLTSGANDLMLTPRFSPTAQMITYMSYFRDKPRVYLFNIDTGSQEVLGDFPSMTFAPRFSPDGNRVIMSLARGGNSDVYVMDLRTRVTERLTNHPGIDTSPSYAPDGSQVTFESSRGGSQQIYVMDSDGGNVHRISSGQGAFGTPVWSPRGDLIAFTRLRRGMFSIGVMRPDGSGMRILTESFLDEGPTWAPNGRVLMFTRQTRYDKRGQGGKTRLWSIDLTGGNEREVLTPMDASDPAWSPLIQKTRTYSGGPISPPDSEIGLAGR